MPKKKVKFNKKDKDRVVKAFKKQFLAGIPVFVTDRPPVPPLKTFTDQDILNAVKEEKQKIFTILNYILNKNSRPLSEGGVDYTKVFEEVQDLENYLLEDL